MLFFFKKINELTVNNNIINYIIINRIKKKLRKRLFGDEKESY